MSSNLYIPKTIKVGFQNREDTFTKQLAYIIYTDDKGVLRKQKSWEGWRDEKITPLDFVNEPTEGFMFNKAIKRYSWSSFSSNRSYIRVHDPRGFEFEITPENLIGVLMEGDVSRRVLQGKFVYSWHGTDLVLLPVASENYQDCVKFTNLQALSVSVADLKPGFVYETKKQEQFVYLGRFAQNENAKKKTMKFYWSSLEKKKLNEWRREKWQVNFGFEFTNTGGIPHISRCMSETSVPEYAQMMEDFHDDRQKKSLTKIEYAPIPKESFGKWWNSHSKKLETNYQTSFYMKDPRPNAKSDDWLYVCGRNDHYHKGKLEVHQICLASNEIAGRMTMDTLWRNYHSPVVKDIETLGIKNLMTVDQIYATISPCYRVEVYGGKNKKYQHTFEDKAMRNGMVEQVSPISTAEDPNE